MTPPRFKGFVRMPDAEFEAILTRAAEGEADQKNVQWTFVPPNAKRALAEVGLDGDEAALDIRDLRSLVDCIRLVRRTAMQTAVRMITTGVMLAAGLAVVDGANNRKTKIFGEQLGCHGWPSKASHDANSDLRRFWKSAAITPSEKRSREGTKPTLSVRGRDGSKC